MEIFQNIPEIMDNYKSVILLKIRISTVTICIKFIKSRISTIGYNLELSQIVTSNS